MQIVGVDNFAEAVDFPPCKCMLASDDEEALIGLENHWKKRLDGVLDAFRSEPYFLEVVPQFIDKGNTVRIAGRSDRDRRRRLRRDHVATCRCRDRDGKCGRFGEGLCGQDDTHQRRRRRSRSRRTDNPG